ncbi:DnaJ protein-like [Durusdinium trenchii]|uniref:DnaJ protein-like n=1 Tax=Durusdinium trenchii TaxID=1381693 RepID=A0ABP0R4T5_9DINO
MARAAWRKPDGSLPEAHLAGRLAAVELVFTVPSAKRKREQVVRLGLQGESSIRVVPNEERFPLAQFDLLSSLQDVPSEEGIVNVQFEVCDVGELCGGKRLVTVKDVASTGNESWNVALFDGHAALVLLLDFFLQHLQGPLQLLKLNVLFLELALYSTIRQKILATIVRSALRRKQRKLGDLEYVKVHRERQQAYERGKAKVTEVTAAELSRDSDDVEEVLAERFLGAAVRASLAAASASNAAMSAAIAAVEGNRQCIQAAQPPEGAKPQENAEAEEKSVQSEDESARSESTSEPGDAGARAGARAETAEEAALKRQITQRNNNHKVLQRLNAEILTHQQNVRQFLQANRQLIPEVSCEAKGKVQMLLRDYAHEVQLELEQFDQYSNLAEDLPLALKQSGLLAPLLQRQVLAIPVCPKARVLKMAALYDLQMTFQVLEQEIFSFARRRMTEGAVDLEPLEVVIEKVHKELQSYTDGAA